LASLPQFFQRTDSPFGSSYEEHVKKFWKFFLSIPKDQNPLAVEKLCTQGQPASQPVFYVPSNLGGKPTEKDCKISSGRGILIPIICIVITEGELEGAPVAALQAKARKDQDSVHDMELEIEVDGNRIVLDHDSLLNFRIITGDFHVNIPPDGIYGKPGEQMAVSDGYYVITKPLTKGDYKINFKGQMDCAGPKCYEPSFRTVNTVNLKVR
jgi:hypothetical protein